MMPFLEDGELRGAGTSYGVLTETPDGHVWAPTTIDSAREVKAWARVPGGDRVLAGTSSGMIYGQDRGCRWASVDGELGQTPIADLALGEGRTPTVFAVTERADGANALWRSDDGGGAWSRTEREGDDVLYSRVLAADGVLAVEGFERGSTAWHVWLSADAGEVWEGSDPGMRLLGVVGEAVLVAVDTDGVWHVHRWDGGALGDSLAQLDSRPDSAGYAGDTLLIWDGDTVVDAGGTVKLDAAHCLLSDVEAGVVWACASTVEDAGGHFWRIDGSGSEVLVSFEDVQPVECPSGSETNDTILERWPSLEQQGVGPGGEDSLDDDVRGCGGCTTAGVWAAALLFFAGVRPRRLVRISHHPRSRFCAIFLDR